MDDNYKLDRLGWFVVIPIVVSWFDDLRGEYRVDRLGMNKSEAKLDKLGWIIVISAVGFAYYLATAGYFGPRLQTEVAFILTMFGLWILILLVLFVLLKILSWIIQILSWVVDQLDRISGKDK